MKKKYGIIGNPIKHSLSPVFTITGLENMTSMLIIQ